MVGEYELEDGSYVFYTEEHPNEWIQADNVRELDLCR